MRIEDEHIDLREARKGLDRGGARIARSRADDGGTLAARLQRMVDEPRQQLHGEVLEGQRRPVEQLQREKIGVELHERRDGGMAEARIGVLDHRAQHGARDLAADIGRDHRFCDFGVRLAGEARDRVASKPRIGLAARYRPPSGARPAISVCVKESGAASPRVEIYFN